MAADLSCLFPLTFQRTPSSLLPMKVILARSAGFCWGVSRAVNIARETAAKSMSPVHTDGPLIHNEQMMEQLRTEGIVECNDLSLLGKGVLVIRAHGISPERRKMLNSLPVTIVDATCPDVARIQTLIRQHASKGYYIVICGDDGHAEVTGLLGYAEGRGFVVSREEDVAKLPDIQPVCLVSQSTQFPLCYAKIADAVRHRFPGAKVLDTICHSTRNRQMELEEMAKSVDAIVVAGGAHSANTVRLVQLAASLKPTIHIQTASQLDPADFVTFKAVGLTAGASTPDFVIEEVRKAIEGMPAA